MRILHKLFTNLTDDEYGKFIKIWKYKDFNKDVFLMKESEEGQTAFILIEGEISVIKETLYNDDYVVTNIKAGGDELFGEINLIDFGKRSSTIKTNTKCKILEIKRDKLLKFMDDNPIIGYKIMWYMARSCAKHLRKADNDVVTLFNALVEVVEND